MFWLHLSKRNAPLNLLQFDNVQEWELPHFKPTIFYKWVYVELLNNNNNIYIYV